MHKVWSPARHAFPSKRARSAARVTKLFGEVNALMAGKKYDVVDGYTRIAGRLSMHARMVHARRSARIGSNSGLPKRAMYPNAQYFASKSKTRGA